MGECSDDTCKCEDGFSFDINMQVCVPFCESWCGPQGKFIVINP